MKDLPENEVVLDQLDGNGYTNKIMEDVEAEEEGREEKSTSHASSFVNLKPHLDRPWYYIDKHFIADKLSYMVQEMRFASHLPFLFSIFTSFGLSKSQAGLISGIRLLGNIFGNLFWGFLADKTRKHKAILLVQAVCAILLFCPQPFVSLQYGNPAGNQCPVEAKTVPGENSTTSRNMTIFNSSFMEVPTQNMMLNSLAITTNNNFTSQTPAHIVSSDNRNDDADTGDTTKLFWILLVMNIGVTFFDGFLPSLLDVAVIRKIHKAPYKTEFGVQRKFGTLGYAAGFVITRVVLDAAPVMGVTCYSLNFAVYAGFIILEAICIYLMYSKSDINRDVANNAEVTPELVPASSENHTYFRTVFKSCTKFSSILFFMTVFIVGMQLASKAFFVVTYLQEKNAPSILFNLFFVVSSLSVFLGLEFSGKIIQMLGGTWNTFIVVFICYFLKFVGLVTLPNAWSLIVTEVLDFACQGCAIPAAILHIYSISTDSNRTTMFGFVNSLQFGFGFIFANIVGGFIYENYGGVTFYSIQAGISLVWVVVLVSYRLYVKLSGERIVDIALTEVK